MASFTEQEQRIAANELRLYGLSYTFTDLVTDEDLILGPYRLVLVKGGVEDEIQARLGTESILHKKAPVCNSWSFFEYPGRTLKFSKSTRQKGKSGV